MGGEVVFSARRQRRGMAKEGYEGQFRHGFAKERIK